MMIAYIDTYRDRFGVEPICWSLASHLEGGFITSRGYRAAKARPTSARAIRDEQLVEEVRRIHKENYGVYGIRKMWRAMKRAGWDIGRDQTGRLMKLAGVEGIYRGRRPITTTSKDTVDTRPDLVKRNFRAPAPQPAVGGGYYLRSYALWLCVYRVRHGRL